MASYTMPLREYIEQASQGQELPVREQIKIGRPKLFDFEYPIFDESYKNVFETNFIRNFYMREIGFETESLFKFQLETWLLINMPYYNKLFESELLQYNPLTNSNINVTHNKTNDINQNDNKDKTKQDERIKNQVDNRETLKNENLNKLEDGNVNSTINQDSIQTSNIQGESNDEANSKNVRNQTKLVNGADVIDNFNRELESLTPDGRLAITTQDGKGIIEYANEIKEKTEKDKKVWDNRTRDEETQETDSTSLSKTNQDSTTNVDTSVVDNVVSKNEVNQNTDAMVDDKFNSSVNDNLNVTENEKLISNINNVEDYVQHTTGKLGIVSYPKLVQEYREALLRIEKQMFYEMNELFMLVY